MKVAKNITLHRTGSEPMPVGLRVPERDKIHNCGVCYTFAYLRTIQGRTTEVHHCPWCQYDEEARDG